MCQPSVGPGDVSCALDDVGDSFLATHVRREKKLYPGHSLGDVLGCFGIQGIVGCGYQKTAENAPAQPQVSSKQASTVGVV